MSASAPTRSTLSIDAGQSAMKTRLTGHDHAVVESDYGGIRTDRELMPQLAAVVEQVAAARNDAIEVVAAGVSGLTGSEADAERLLSLTAHHGVQRVILAHDSVTSFLGTLGDQQGAVVAAGTGVVTLGVGRSSVVRIDGWGNIMGDAGSGYWIGREALDAAMRAYDGRGTPTALLDLLRSRWPDPETAYVQLQGDPARVEVVASLSWHVSELAAHDSTAAAICLSAARELSHSVATALRRVSADGVSAEDARPAVSAIGGVFRSPIIRARFEELLFDALPQVQIEEPHGGGIDGVAALQELPPTHPLHEAVASATRKP